MPSEKVPPQLSCRPPSGAGRLLSGLHGESCCLTPACSMRSWWLGKLLVSACPQCLSFLCEWENGEIPWQALPNGHGPKEFIRNRVILLRWDGKPLSPSVTSKQSTAAWISQHMSQKGVLVVSLSAQQTARVSTPPPSCLCGSGPSLLHCRWSALPSSIAKPTYVDVCACVCVNPWEHRTFSWGKITVRGEGRKDSMCKPGASRVWHELRGLYGENLTSASLLCFLAILVLLKQCRIQLAKHTANLALRCGGPEHHVGCCCVAPSRPVVLLSATPAASALLGLTKVGALGSAMVGWSIINFQRLSSLSHQVVKTWKSQVPPDRKAANSRVKGIATKLNRRSKTKVILHWRQGNKTFSGNCCFEGVWERVGNFVSYVTVSETAEN